MRRDRCMHSAHGDTHCSGDLADGLALLSPCEDYRELVLIDDAWPSSHPAAPASRFEAVLPVVERVCEHLKPTFRKIPVAQRAFGQTTVC